MFDIGFWELAIIGVVGLLVIGPERLPGVARTIGLYVGKLQRFVQGVKSDIRHELDAGELRDLISQQDKQLKELQTLVNDTRDEVQGNVQEIGSELGEASGKYAGIGTSLGSDPLADSGNSPSGDSSTDAGGATETSAIGADRSAGGHAPAAGSDEPPGEQATDSDAKKSA